MSNSTIYSLASLLVTKPVESVEQRHVRLENELIRAHAQRAQHEQQLNQEEEAAHNNTNNKKSNKKHNMKVNFQSHQSSIPHPSSLSSFSSSSHPLSSSACVEHVEAPPPLPPPPTATATATTQRPASARPATRSKSRSPTRASPSSYFDMLTDLPPPAWRPSSARPLDLHFYNNVYRFSKCSAAQTQKRSRPTSASPSPSPTLSPSPCSVAPCSISAASSPPSPPLSPGQVSAATRPARTTHKPLTPEQTRHSRAPSKAVVDSTPTTTLEQVRQHFEPQMHNKQSKIEDLSARVRKQESRLSNLNVWKLKALAMQNAEPNPLDFVLTNRGVMESTKVKSIRHVMQRIMIRQFVKTFRLLRCLKSAHHQLHALFPLLLSIPNLSPALQEQLTNMETAWKTDLPVYRKRPHAYLFKLLSNLFDMTPLVHSALLEFLQQNAKLQQESELKFTDNSSFIRSHQLTHAQLEKESNEVENLKLQQQHIEQEIVSVRAIYQQVYESLETTMRKEQKLLNQLNDLHDNHSKYESRPNCTLHTSDAKYTYDHGADGHAKCKTKLEEIEREYSNIFGKSSAFHHIHHESTVVPPSIPPVQSLSDSLQHSYSADQSSGPNQPSTAPHQPGHINVESPHHTSSAIHSPSSHVSSSPSASASSVISYPRSNLSFTKSPDLSPAASAATTHYQEFPNHALLPPSPFANMSDQLYHATLHSAYTQLLSMGYPSDQAFDFAPHMVSAGVANVPAHAASSEPPKPQPWYVQYGVKPQLARKTTQPQVFHFNTRRVMRPSASAAQAGVTPSPPSHEASAGSMPARRSVIPRPSSALHYNSTHPSTSPFRNRSRPVSAKPKSRPTSAQQHTRMYAMSIGLPSSIASYKPPPSATREFAATSTEAFSSAAPTFVSAAYVPKFEKLASVVMPSAPKQPEDPELHLISERSSEM